ncbi:MAG: cytochrome C [Burkholderiales bacterium]
MLLNRILIGLAAIALLALSPARAQDLARGKAIYETRCIGCHSMGVHVRESRKARDFAGVRAQVVRWTTEAGGTWTPEEIDDVAAYLNELYYRYPCPVTVCKADKAGAAAAGGG